jgi:hypothetical protein
MPALCIYGSQLSGHIMRGSIIMATLKYWYVVNFNGNKFKFKTLKAARERAQLINGMSDKYGTFTIISREERI